MVKRKTCITLTLVSVLAAILLLYLSSFFMAPYPSDEDYQDEYTNEVRARQSRVMRSYMNASVDPCYDFYEYACGNWEEMNPIPKDDWEYSTTDRLQDDLDAKLRDLLATPIEDDDDNDDDDDDDKDDDDDDDPPSALNKVKMFYHSCVDSETINKRGVDPLLEFIEELGGWPVLDDDWTDANFSWQELALKLNFLDTGVLLAYDIEKSARSEDRYAIYLRVPTLGLEDPEKYVDDEYEEDREAYRTFIEDVLDLLGVDEDEAENVSQEIFDFETLLAKAAIPPQKPNETRFVHLTLEELKERYPYADWKTFFDEAQHANVDWNETISLDVSKVRRYYNNLADILEETNNETLANYMVFQAVFFLLDSLPQTYSATYNQYNKIVTGQEEPMPWWKRCVDEANTYMGMATSAMFVREHFDESSKQEAIEIIEELKMAFSALLLELDWLDDETLHFARQKAEGISVNAGYPDFLLDDDKLNKFYDDLEIVKGKNFENMINMMKHFRQEALSYLSKPYDLNRWLLPPSMVNALYDIGSNRITVLAGVLQPPVFHRNFPASLNYGSMGMFMGHEIIHAFDDVGRLFDHKGNMLQWWTEDDKKQFDERQKCFQEHYEKLSHNDIHFDSDETKSEDLADNGGLRLAYRAFTDWKDKNLHPKSTIVSTLPDLDLDEDQLFFLGFAQTFCYAVRPESAKKTSHSQHSPDKYRVQGVVTNFEKFAEAFKCPTDSPMNPTEKCRMW